MAVPPEHHDAFTALIEMLIENEVARGPVALPDLKLRIYEELRKGANSVIERRTMYELDPESNGKYDLDGDMRLIKRK